MPKLLQSVISKVRKYFSKGPRKLDVRAAPKTESTLFQTQYPHRGQALRDLQNPDLTLENLSKWRNLSQENVDAFLNDEEIIFVHSSNVVSVQYFHSAQKMMVEFKHPRTGQISAYMYSECDDSMAVSFLQAGSKGGWVWDNLRVRGSKTAHRKPYVRIK